MIQGDFSDADVPGMTLKQSHIRHSAFLSADLGRLRLVDVLVEDSDFAGAQMPEASFTRVTFRSCRMSSALLAQARLRDVTFSESKLDDVNFRMSQGDRVVSDDVNLRGADFYAAHLTSARFYDCDMSGTEVSQAILPRARLHGSLLSDIKGGEYLRDVVIDSSQVLPLTLQVFRALDIRVEDEREASILEPDASPASTGTAPPAAGAASSGFRWSLSWARRRGRGHLASTHRP